MAVLIEQETVLVGEFEDAVRRSESMWTLSLDGVGGPQLVLSLEKTRKTWWKSAVVGHPEIDTTKVSFIVIAMSAYHFNIILQLFPLLSTG